MSIITDIKYYIINRWLDRSHLIDTRLQKGQYHENDDKILYGMFAVLCDYVEQELAEVQDYLEHTKVPGYVDENTEAPDKGFWANLKYKFSWLSDDDRPALGIRYLVRSIAELKLENVDPAADEEILALYKWWKFERDQRPDPSKEEDIEKQIDLEQQYIQDDSDHLKRLVDVRTSIWM